MTLLKTTVMKAWEEIDCATLQSLASCLPYRLAECIKRKRRLQTTRTWEVLVFSLFLLILYVFIKVRAKLQYFQSHKLHSNIYSYG